MEPRERLRQQRCNEACLERIAARLCQLSNTAEPNSCVETSAPVCTTVAATQENVTDCGGCCCSQKQANPAGGCQTEDTNDKKNAAAACCRTAEAVVASAASDCPSACCKKPDDIPGRALEESCDSGCCTEPNVPLQKQQSPTNDLGQVKLANEPSTQGECCTGSVDQFSTPEIENFDAASCGKPKLQGDIVIRKPSSVGCCAKDSCTVENPSKERSAQGCCSSSEAECYSRPPTAAANRPQEYDCTDSPSDGNTSDEKSAYTPCVDECCVGDDGDSVQSNSWASGTDLHLAFDKYASMLRRGQCLCRRAIAQLGFNCCATTSAGALAQPSKLTAMSSKDVKYVRTSVGEVHERCTSTMSITPKKPYDVSVQHKKPHADVEKQAGCEHVVLNVTGMTCTGCSKKLMNVITPIDGISNPQVTFVSGKAEFDYDSSNKSNIEAVMHRIGQETGFKLSRMVSGHHIINVFLPSPTASHMQTGQIHGIISVHKIKGEKFCITYDPSVIGARSLLNQGAQLAPPSPEARILEDQRHLRKTAIHTALAAVLTVPVLVLEWSKTGLSHKTRAITTLVLSTGVQLVAVPEFYIGAIKSLIFSRVIEMDMLVVISITAAYAYSVVAFALEQAGVELQQAAFFETSTLLITLVLFGRLTAAWARMRAVATVSLRSLQAQTALLINSSGQAEDIDARLLEYGDEILIPAHARIVTDGKILSGSGEVDESMLTGESSPVVKKAGDLVIAGTVNGSGTLSVAITRLPGENSITDIARLVEDAVASKPKVQELADKIASWFIPAVLVITAIVFIIWIAVGIRVRDMAAGNSAGLAITYAIAVLAISCPCAIGLAVPMVLIIAGGIAARAGVIIKAAHSIESGNKITDMVFDKTGTLTEGNLQVMAEELIPSAALDAAQTFSFARAITKGQKHPVAISVAGHLSSMVPELNGAVLEGVTSIPGAGIEANSSQGIVRAGNPSWLNVETHPAVAGRLQQGMTLFCLTVDHELVLVFGLGSHVRANACTVIEKLHQRGMSCHIVSGDNVSAVSAVARTLNIPSDCVAAQRTPAGKQQYVQDLQRRGRKVLFIGDGTNDAVAIAQADIGMQMGSTSDVTGAVADVVLMSGNLHGILSFLDLSAKSLRRIVFNFAWSAVYNFFAILMTSGALVKFRIPPRFAGLGEMVSVLPVIFAAATLFARFNTGSSDE